MNRKNVHIIERPTLEILGTSAYGKSETQYQIECLLASKNIYITSDEEIKNGDWVLWLSQNKIIKCEDSSLRDRQDMVKKIILTTDRNLIKDGVQPIPDEFLGWLVENQSCEFVNVKKEASRECNCYYTKFCQSTTLDTKTHCRDGGSTKTHYEIMMSAEEINQGKLENLIMAYKSGKTIQSKSSGEWKDFVPQNQVDSPNWEYMGIENWRIKPDDITEELSPRSNKQISLIMDLAEKLKKKKSDIDPKIRSEYNQTLEEIQKNTLIKENYKPDYISFGLGYKKGQGEGLYTREEVLDHLNHLLFMRSSEIDLFTDDDNKITMKWFEQFKNK